MKSDLSSINNLYINKIITEDEYKNLTERLDNNTKRNTKDNNIEEMLDGFHSWCETKGYSKNTIQGYKSEASALLKFVTNIDSIISLRNTNIKNISNRSVMAYVKSCIGSQTSRNFFTRMKYGLDSFFDYLNEIYNIKIDKSTLDDVNYLIKSKGRDNSYKIILRDEEIRSVINSSDLRGKVCILLCYEGMLKQNELVMTREQDFDFENNTLKVYDNKTIFSKSDIEQDKRELDRIVNLSKDTINIVLEYLSILHEDIERWNDNRIRIGNDVRDDTGFIFQSVKTTVPSYGLINSIFKESSRRYYSNVVNDDNELKDKIYNFTSETVRNSRRVWLFKEGYPTNKIQLMAGDLNYNSCNKFKKYVSIIYPESLK